MNPVTPTPLHSAGNNPLQGLHDIHIPGSPELWPLAPGWWMVIGLVILTGIIVGLRWRLKQRWHQYLLAQIEAVINKPDTDPGQQLAGLSAILRRAALKRFPREQVATLHGQQWLDFLQKTSHDKHFDKTIIQPLADGMYQANSGRKLLTKDDPLVQVVIKWVQENLS